MWTFVVENFTPAEQTARDDVPARCCFVVVLVVVCAVEFSELEMVCNLCVANNVNVLYSTYSTITHVAIRCGGVVALNIEAFPKYYVFVSVTCPHHTSLQTSLPQNLHQRHRKSPSLTQSCRSSVKIVFNRRRSAWWWACNGCAASHTPPHPSHPWCIPYKLQHIRNWHTFQIDWVFDGVAGLPIATPKQFNLRASLFAFFVPSDAHSKCQRRP